MITVNEHAYITKAREINNYTKTHEKLLLALIHEKKYYTKDELLCFTGHNMTLLEIILEELKNTGVIIIEGWLVKLKEIEKFNLEICEEIAKTEKY